VLYQGDVCLGGGRIAAPASADVVSSPRTAGRGVEAIA
jgi:hypothetical protein